MRILSPASQNVSPSTTQLTRLGPSQLVNRADSVSLADACGAASFSGASGSRISPPKRRVTPIPIRKTEAARTMKPVVRMGEGDFDLHRGERRNGIILPRLSRSSAARKGFLKLMNSDLRRQN